MVQHIVLIKLKPGITDDQVMEVFRAGEHLANDTEGMVEFGIGLDRSNPSHGFTLASVLKFTDDESLRTYLDDPARRDYLAEHVAPITEERIEIDVPTEGMHRPGVRQNWSWGGSIGMLEDLS